MSKELLKKATTGASERVLRDLMPDLNESLNQLKSAVQSVQNDLRSLDAKMDGLRQEMLDRFEQNLAVINEVSHRVTRVEGKIEGYMEAMSLFMPSPDVKSGRKKRAV